MNELKTLPGRFKGYGLVRDENGKPIFDDINHIPDPIWNMLTVKEQEEINSVRDASR